MTTRRYYANSAPQQTLAAAITAADTTLQVTSFDGWPSSYPFFATVALGADDEEIVSVTGVTGSTATITRGEDGSTAVSHLAGATLDQAVVAQDFDEASAHTSADDGVHGVTGDVVGTTDTQTLTNKTLTAPTITDPVGVVATSADSGLTLLTKTAAEYAALTPDDSTVYVVTA